MLKGYLAILIILAGCNPLKKALKVANENPKEFAQFCADAFPVKDSVIVRDSIWFDTLYLENEPEVDIRYVKDSVIKTITIPGKTYFVTKTVIKDSIVIRKDIAKETALQKQNDDLIVVNKDLVGARDKFKKRSDFWMWVAIALGLTWVIKIVLSIWGGNFNITKLFKK